MTNEMFREMFESVVAEAQNQLCEEEKVMKTSPEYLMNELNTANYHDIISDKLAGYDNKYMSRNDYRVAHKVRYTSESAISSTDEYFDYLFASFGLQPQVKKVVKSFKSRPNSEIWKSTFNHKDVDLSFNPCFYRKATIRRMCIARKASFNDFPIILFPFDISEGFDLTFDSNEFNSTFALGYSGKREPKLASVKFNGFKKVEKVQPSFKIKEKFSKKSTYVPSNPTVIERPVAYVPSNKDYDIVYIRDFSIYHDFIVLEVERKFDVDTSEYRREDHDDKFFNIVFHYDPYDRYGRPNPYNGYAELTRLLKSMKCVMKEDPQNLEDALRASIGGELEITDYPMYDMASTTIFMKTTEHTYTNGKKFHKFDVKRYSTDNKNVFKMYGDIEFLTNEFEVMYKPHAYVPVSDYELNEDSKLVEFTDECGNSYSFISKK